MLLTHAHLDHCGLLPDAGQGGLPRPDPCDGGHGRAGRRSSCWTPGKLHEEFAKRDARWEKRNPDKAAAEDREDADAYAAAVALAEAGADGAAGATGEAGEHVPTTVEPVLEPTATGHWPRDPEAELRAQPPELEVDLDEPLYTAKDAERALAQFRPVDVRARRSRSRRASTPRSSTPGTSSGSAIIRLRVADRDGGEERVIVCSGDLGRPGTPILRDPTAMTAADYVLVESTYGGREHEPGEEAIRILAETVRLVAESDGVLLVPSFAIGRTQEVVWQLDRLIERGEIPLAAALPRLTDGLEGLRHLPPPPRRTTTRRRPSCCATATRRSTTRTRSSRTT